MNDDIGAKDALIAHLERTLRDRQHILRNDFAKAALIGLLSHSGVASSREILAQEAFAIARAMVDAA